MSGSLNHVILVGNLGKDPEIRNTSGENQVMNLSVATSETWRDKQTQERQEKTEWHRVVCFNQRIIGYVGKYAKKGDKVSVIGALQTRKWTDNSGAEKYTTEVVINQFRGEIQILSPRNQNGAGQGAGDQGGGDDLAAPQGNRSAGSGGGARKPAGPIDDDIPF